MAEIKRGILKLSGERFSENGDPLSSEQFNCVARQLVTIADQTNLQLAIVVGGGNIFRGRQASDDSDKNEADTMGMLATVINGVGLRAALRKNGSMNERLMTAFPLTSFAEPYIRLKARHHLENNRMVIIAGGLGRPHSSTDSAVAQYARELDCGMIFKASTIDGVYDDDPKKNKDARRISHLTFDYAIGNRLRVMDQTAFTMCNESGIPIFVFNIDSLDKLPEIIKGDYSYGSLITREGNF